jgi:hypothetical protein
MGLLGLSENIMAGRTSYSQLVTADGRHLASMVNQILRSVANMFSIAWGGCSQSAHTSNCRLYGTDCHWVLNVNGCARFSTLVRRHINSTWHASTLVQPRVRETYIADDNFCLSHNFLTCNAKCRPGTQDLIGQECFKLYPEGALSGNIS